MPRSKGSTIIPKTIGGKAVTQTEFKEAIIVALHELGHAKPREVALQLGPEWSQNAAAGHRLAQTMSNMLRGGRLTVKDGYYSVSVKHTSRFTRGSLEESVIETIRYFGGLARARDILEDFGARPAAHKDAFTAGGRGGGHARNIYRVLRESPRIVRYEGARTNNALSAMWGLPWGKMLQEPLTGASFDFLAKGGFLLNSSLEGQGGRDREAALYERIKHHYEKVGAAFREAREAVDFDIDNVVANKEVRDQLEDIKNRGTTLTTRIYDEIRSEAERMARSANRGDDAAYVRQLREIENGNVHAYFLAYFERGDPMTHTCAHANFYRVFAKMFGICPASLSRGTVVPMLAPVESPEEDSAQSLIELTDLAAV